MPVVRLLLLLLAALICVPSAHAQTFPKLTGRVVDNANLLDPAQEQALTAKLADLEKASGRQLVVATVPDLQGQEVADYAYQLGRTWQIGQKGKDDGVILLVAPKERKVWISVGYGLEGVLTDALSSRIYRNAIVPRFKANDYPGGIDAGVDQIAELLKLPPDEAAKRAAEADKAAKTTQGGNVNIGMVVFWLVIILVFVVPLALRSSRNGKRYGRGGGLPPVILWGPGLGGWGDNDRGGGGSGWGGDGGGFSGGGGSFGGGGAGGDW